MVLLSELLEVGASAEQDDAVADAEGFVARGGELDAAVGPLDGDDDHAGAPADVEFSERQAREWALTATSDNSMARLERWVTSSTNSTALGLVRIEKIRCAPMAVGRTT